MRTEEPRPVRLRGLSPARLAGRDRRARRLARSDGDAGARERSSSSQTRRPAAPAPLVLDGDGLNLVSLKLDGEPLAAERYVATPDSLTIAQPPQRPFRLEIETLVDPSANTQLMGLYRSGATYCTQCEAEGFRRITYFLDRPDVMAVYTTRIEAEQGRGAGAACQRQSGRLRATSPARPAISRSGTIRSQSRATCSRWSAASSAVVEDSFRTMSGRDGRAAHLCRARQGGPLRLRHGRASSAPCAGTRRRSAANTTSTFS